VGYSQANGFQLFPATARNRYNVGALSTTPLPRLVEDYLADCRARNLSPNTVKLSYGYPLRSILLPFCEAQGIETAAGLEGRSLNRLSSQLLDQGGARGKLTPHTVHAYMRAVNQFLAWARREGEIDGEARGRLPQLPKKLVEVLTVDEIKAMEDLAATERDKLIVRVLADTGIRVGELVGLAKRDLVELNHGYALRIRGRSGGGGAKGDRDRLMPLTPVLYRRLRTYGDRGRPKGADGDRIFLSLMRRPHGGGYEPLTESGVQQMTRNLAERAGITKRVHPHLFRHSFATEMLNRGMNPIALAENLGHSSLAMIQRVYAHLSVQDRYEELLKVLRDRD